MLGIAASGFDYDAWWSGRQTAYAQDIEWPAVRRSKKGCGSGPGWGRIFSTTGRSRMAAMILSSPAPQFAQVLHVEVQRALEQLCPADAVRPGLDCLDFALDGGCSPFGRLPLRGRPLRHHQRPQLGMRVSTPAAHFRCGAAPIRE
jgi:hypothetical protein